MEMRGMNQQAGMTPPLPAKLWWVIQDSNLEPMD